MSVLGRCAMAIALARRAGVYRVELVPVRREIFQGIGLDERKWVMFLRRAVNANNLKSSEVISEGGTTTTAKEV